MEGTQFNFNPSIDAGPEEVKKIKERLNNEGMEGRAAVIVGTEKETEVIQKRIEKEGCTKDLASYIHLHKEILIKKDVIPEFEGKLRKPIVPGTLIFPNQITNERSAAKSVFRKTICYVDKNGDIAEVIVDPAAIADFNENAELRRGDFNKIVEEFKKLGFTEPDSLTAMDLRELVNLKIQERSEDYYETESESPKEQAFNF